jgi:thymidine phosphorylase
VVKCSRPKINSIEQVKDIGVCLVSQSSEIAIADKKLYSLRDVTATVSSIPLIASSIMSKKIASGVDKLVLDVTVGSGAFIQNIDEAIQENESETFVWIKDQQGKAVKRIIKTGLQGLDNIEVKSGLKPGDEILIPSLETPLNEGDHVVIKMQ